MKFTLKNLFLAILFASIFYVGLKTISDPDFWWHLRTGQLIAQTWAIPHTDPFSFTQFGKPWIAHEWLSELFIFWLYRLGSYGLLIIVFALIFSLAFFLTYLRCPKESKPYVAGFTLLLGVLVSYPVFDVRPQMISLLITSIFLFLLDKYRISGKLRFILPLPLIMLVWVNLHAGYFLGFVIIAIYIVGEAFDWAHHKFSNGGELTGSPVKSLWVLLAVLFLCIFASLINPNGYKILVYPFQTLNDPAMRQYIQEWQSPDFHSVNLPFAFMILALIGLGLTGKQRISVTQILLTLAFGFEALQAIRNIPLFALVAVPIIAEQISAWIKIQSAAQIPARLLWVIPVLLVGMAALMTLNYLKVNSEQSTVEAEDFPKAAVDWILENQPQGKIFNSYGWGGYLIWRLYPEYLVYIDGRADVYGDKLLTEYANLSANPDWEQSLDQQGVHLVLIEPNSNFANVLRQSSAWTISYQDANSIIFTKNR